MLLVGRLGSRLPLGLGGFGVPTLAEEEEDKEDEGNANRGNLLGLDEDAVFADFSKDSSLFSTTFFHRNSITFGASSFQSGRIASFTFSDCFRPVTWSTPLSLLCRNAFRLTHQPSSRVAASRAA